MKELSAIIGILLCAMVLLMAIKTKQPVYNLLAEIVILLILSAKILESFAGLLSELEAFQRIFSAQQVYMKLLLKAMGAGLVCQLGADVCKDAGYQSIANQIELLGKLYILVTGLPLIDLLIKTIQEFSL